MADLSIQIASLKIRIWIKRSVFQKMSKFDKGNLRDSIKKTISDSNIVIKLEELFRDYGLPITCNSEDELIFTL